MSGMRKPRFFSRPFFLLVLFAGLAIVLTWGTSHAKSEQKSHDARTEEARTRKDVAESLIETLNKNKSCDGDSECEVLEMGDRSCGGPSKYLVVSVRNVNLPTIRQRITEFTAAQKELNLLETPGDCAPTPKLPAAHCVKNTCGGDATSGASGGGGAK